MSLAGEIVSLAGIISKGTLISGQLIKIVELGYGIVEFPDCWVNHYVVEVYGLAKSKY